MRPFKHLFLLLLLAGCASGPTFFSENYLASMASEQFEQLKQEMPISNDPAGNAQVMRVSNRIAETLGSEMPEADWEYVLFDDPAANAFAMPGGKIAVFTGLLDLVESDDELAAVVGHEIAHILLKHSNQRMSAEVLRAIGGAAAVVGTSNMKDEDRAMILAAYGAGSQVGIILPYSRLHERQADQLGLMIAARSGYDPRAAIEFWKKMQAASTGSSVPEFLSTHPGHETRIEGLRKAMPEAMRYYEAHQNP